MWEFLTGVVAGTVSGTGMGGGTILILVLSVLLGIEQHTAQATNLIFFIPTSISAIIVSIKAKLIEWKIGIPISIIGVIGSIIRSKYISKIRSKSIKKVFWNILSIYCDL